MSTNCGNKLWDLIINEIELNVFHLFIQYSIYTILNWIKISAEAWRQGFYCLFDFNSSNSHYIFSQLHAKAWGTISLILKQKWDQSGKKRSRNFLITESFKELLLQISLSLFALAPKKSVNQDLFFNSPFQKMSLSVMPKDSGIVEDIFLIFVYSAAAFLSTMDL